MHEELARALSARTLSETAESGHVAEGVAGVHLRRVGHPPDHGGERIFEALAK